MENQKQNQTGKREEWMMVGDLAKQTSYKRGYLSLMARQGKIKSRKYKGNWYSTLDSLREFEEEKKRVRKERNDELRKLYREKSEREKAVAVTPKKAASFKVKIKQDNLFDEVQRELQEVLGEIREKQVKLKKGFAAYKNEAKEESRMSEKLIEKERRETEDLSEKLIMDLGKLINTAHKVQEEASPLEKEEEASKVSPEDLYSIPVKRMTHVKAGDGKRLIDLDRRNMVSRVQTEKKIESQDLKPMADGDNFLNESYNYFPFEREDREAEDAKADKLNKFLIIIIGILFFIAFALLLMIIGF